MQCVIGVDLGGTNVRAQALYEDGSPAGERFEQPSRAQDGDQATYAALAETIVQARDAAAHPPAHVGLAIPGHVDDRNGMIRWAPNFGREIGKVWEPWRNKPIRAELEPRVGLPICMGNDANLAALGEYRFGTGRNQATCLVLVTLGTGVGGGVVMSPGAVDGHASGPLLLVGGNTGGVEIGHLIIQHGGLDCNAGSYGSLEAYCQRDGIVNRARHLLQRGRPSVLHEMLAGDLNALTPKHLSMAAEQGDELAIQVWRDVGVYLGVGIGSLINLFAPEVVAIGGQIAQAGEVLLGPARESARDTAVPSLFEESRIVLAEQIEDAGILGAAALAFERLEG